MKPASKDLRSLEQNALIHAVFREILNHLIANGVKLPAGKAGEYLVKELCKTEFGAKIRVNGIPLNVSTADYDMSGDDPEKPSMSEFIGKVAAWAATDLNLELQI